MTSARPDTRYLADSPITTDTSQWLTDLTAAAPGGYELASDRTALDGTEDGRSLELAATLSATSSGTLLDHAGPNPYTISVDAGLLTFQAGGGTVASLSLPAAGSTDYIIAWNTEPNPLTTGGSDALRSEFTLFDVANTTLSRETLAHAVVTADPTATFTVGGAWNGASMVNPLIDGTITGVRVSGRFHTRVEMREHWVAPTAAPTIDGVTAVERVVWPRQSTEAGHGAGPAYQAAAGSMAVGASRHRLLSPLVQVLVRQPPTYEDFLQDVVSSKLVFELGDGWQTGVQWLWARRVPRSAGFVRVRVQWATWKTGMSTSTVELRAHCATGAPHTTPQESTTVISRAVDDGVNGAGVHQVFDLLLVQRDGEGYSWIYLSARIDEGSGAGGMAYSIREVTITPVTVSEGYDNDNPPNGFGP